MVIAALPAAPAPKPALTAPEIVIATSQLTGTPASTSTSAAMALMTFGIAALPTMPIGAHPAPRGVRNSSYQIDSKNLIWLAGFFMKLAIFLACLYPLADPPP
jgi:hypothetical protein